MTKEELEEKVKEVSKPTYHTASVTCDNPYGYCDGDIDENGNVYNEYGRVCSKIEREIWGY